MVTVAQVTAACTGHKDSIKITWTLYRIQECGRLGRHRGGAGEGKSGVYPPHEKNENQVSWEKSIDTEEKRFSPQGQPKWMELQARVKR